MWCESSDRRSGPIARDDDELSDVDLFIDLPHDSSPADELLTVLGL
jgi:hypothetical protein